MLFANLVLINAYLNIVVNCLVQSALYAINTIGIRLV